MSTPPMLQALNEVSWSVSCVGAAFLFVWLGFQLFNRLPADWFCDYGDSPDYDMRHELRLLFTPSGVLCSLVLAFFWVCCKNAYGVSLTFLLVCAVLLCALMITLADIKYSVIPDQFTFAVLIICTLSAVYDLSGPNVFHGAWWSPFAGAATGFALMLGMNGLGLLFYRKEGMGFGDIKLFTVLGVMLGWRNMLLLFFLALLLAFFHFVFLLARSLTLKDVYLPMGPYICLALAVLLAFLKPLNGFVDSYLALIHF